MIDAGGAQSVDVAMSGDICNWVLLCVFAGQVGQAYEEVYCSPSPECFPIGVSAFGCLFSLNRKKMFENVWR